MSDIAIRVENLSKRYRIGQRERYYTLRDTLANLFTRPFRRSKATDHKTTDNMTTDRNPVGSGPVVSGQSSRNHDEWIWALKDVSFEVKHGEVVGIIGRNGAGKTTLLKILSRITEPTKGCVTIHGRVGSLLEVGTGFHPELTGRENIYLNGAILGMKKAEIEGKLDEIVAFAEVEKFIDTPVKHYSGGMYVRLAFAVAAHLEPEILLVDEVLAVGDLGFQRKCIRKMREIAGQGVALLFVSHNMHITGILAGKVIYLKRGLAEYIGPTSMAIRQYMSEPQIRDDFRTPSHLPHGVPPDSKYCILNVTVQKTVGDIPVVRKGDDLRIDVHYQLPENGNEMLHFNLSIWSDAGALVTSSDTRLKSGLDPTGGEGFATCTFARMPLLPGQYYVRAYLLDAGTDCPLASFAWEDGRTCFFIVTADHAKIATQMIWIPSSQDFGVVELPSRWSFTQNTR